LGFIGYYIKFIKNYGKIVAPLTILLKKMFEAADQALQDLKYVMCTTPVLAPLDFNKTFVLERDKSSKGIDAILV
jgi:hypothetical protein